MPALDPALLNLEQMQPTQAIDQDLQQAVDALVSRYEGEAGANAYEPQLFVATLNGQQTLVVAVEVKFSVGHEVHYLELPGYWVPFVPFGAVQQCEAANHRYWIGHHPIAQNQRDSYLKNLQQSFAEYKQRDPQGAAAILRTLNQA